MKTWRLLLAFPLLFGCSASSPDDTESGQDAISGTPADAQQRQREAELTPEFAARQMEAIKREYPAAAAGDFEAVRWGDSPEAVQPLRDKVQFRHTPVHIYLWHAPSGPFFVMQTGEGHPQIVFFANAAGNLMGRCNVTSADSGLSSCKAADPSNPDPTLE